MIGPRKTYHAEQSHTPTILPAMRELLSQHPYLADSGPEELQMYLRVYLPRSPQIFEIEAALDALRVGEQVVA